MTRLIFALLVAFPLGAQAQTWTGASNPDDLLYRLDILDAELADIRARLGGQAPAPGVGGNNAALEAELGRLTSQVEELQFENRQLKALIERQLEDLIFRVTELEGGDLASVGPVDLGTPAQTSPAPVILSEQADLDRARLDIQQGRFDQGEGRLRDFIADYPSSNLVGEAHYWLGQSQFTRGDFAGAATAYLSGFRTAETGPYASDNLFQLGVTLGRLGQIEPACSTLREVGRRFPNASSTIRDGARSELASLDCG